MSTPKPSSEQGTIENEKIATTSAVTSYPALFHDVAIDHAIAGLGAGTFATLVMHPLDLVKVRFQLANTPSTTRNQSASDSIKAKNSASSLSSNHSQAHPNAATASTKPRFGTAVYHALKDAVRQDGYAGLYRGLVPNLVGGASSWGLYFLFYNMLKSRMQSPDSEVKTTPQQHLLAAAEASTASALLTNPIWVVKTRVFASPRNSEAGRAYKGLWHGLVSIYKTEGIRGLYKGSLLALVGVSNGSIQFAAYEEIKTRRAMIKRRNIEKAGGKWTRADEKLSNWEYIFASGTSKLVAIALTYPYQVIRTRIQNAETSHLYPNIPKTISRTFKEEGLRAFYKGLGTNALRILPGTCTTFVVYENLVWAFREAAEWRDGKHSMDQATVKR